MKAYTAQEAKAHFGAFIRRVQQGPVCVTPALFNGRIAMDQWHFD